MVNYDLRNLFTYVHSSLSLQTSLLYSFFCLDLATRLLAKNICIYCELLFHHCWEIDFAIVLRKHLKNMNLFFSVFIYLIQNAKYNAFQQEMQCKWSISTDRRRLSETYIFSKFLAFNVHVKGIKNQFSWNIQSTAEKKL